MQMDNDKKKSGKEYRMNKETKKAIDKKTKLKNELHGN